jgi:hypothetical protein
VATLPWTPAPPLPPKPDRTRTEICVALMVATKDESGEGGANESEDRERLRRRSGLRIFLRGRSNAAAGASSKTGPKCLPLAEPELLTPFPFQPLPRP